MTLSSSRPGVRAANRAEVLRVILRRGPLARVELASATGFTPAAISNITRDLLEGGLLTEVGVARNNRVGASAILLDLPDTDPAIGVVHQGVSALRIGICTLRGRVLARRLVRTPTAYSGDWAAQTIARVIRELCGEMQADASRLLGVSVGVVGLVDTDHGIIRRAPSLGWADVPLGPLLAGALEIPVAVENNVRAMAKGEALLGNGRGWPDFAFVYIGTGIGSGLIVDGHPYRGFHGGAGELGHITVDPDGELCVCGNRGCLEAVAAEPALVRHALRRGITFPAALGDTKERARALAEMARSGDAAAREIIVACGESLGIALADLVDLLDPGRVVLHGAITRAGELLFEPVQRTMRQRAFIGTHHPITLALPTFGDDAGLVGAAAVALDALVLSGATAVLPAAVPAAGAEVGDEALPTGERRRLASSHSARRLAGTTAHPPAAQNALSASAQTD